MKMFFTLAVWVAAGVVFLTHDSSAGLKEVQVCIQKCLDAGHACIKRCGDLDCRHGCMRKAGECQRACQSHRTSLRSQDCYRHCEEPCYSCFNECGGDTSCKIRCYLRADSCARGYGYKGSATSGNTCDLTCSRVFTKRLGYRDRTLQV